MKTRITLLGAACVLALVGCGDKSSGVTDTAPAADAAPAPEAVESAPASAPAADETPAPMPAPGAAAGDKAAAVVTACATEIEGSDAMQYNVGSIAVPASCTEFKITLKHTGKMPVAAMGHNVVISKVADMQQITAAGMGAGLDNGYIKSDDPNVIAHTKMVGGGETTSVSFAVSKIKGDGPYEFFCSFPGHSGVMKGVIAVESSS